MRSRTTHPSLSLSCCGARETAPPTEVPGEEWWRKCPGCRGRQNQHDDRHNRVPGQCKYPRSESISWKCEGCRFHRPRGHPTHTMGPDCKQNARVSHAEAGTHEPQLAKLLMILLVIYRRNSLMVRILANLRKIQLRVPEPKDASSSAALPSDVEEADYAPSDAENAAPAAASAAPSDLPAPAEICRKPAPRNRRVFREAGVGHEVPSDWTRFDISRSMRVLRDGNERAIRTELRKLPLFTPGLGANPQSSGRSPAYRSVRAR